LDAVQPTHSKKEINKLKNKLPLLIGGFLAVLVVVGAIGAGVAYADKSTPLSQIADGRGPRDGRGLPQAELEAAAKVLGMTADELSTALQSGQTLEDLATAKSVDIAKVQDAINAVHREEMRTQIKQAVTDGTMTQAKADWLLEGLDKGYLDGGPGFGMGIGRGGHGGPDGMGQPPVDQVAPTATP
jgi:hypothetical protein